MKAVKAENFLRVSEIFFSLQGETRTVGIPTVFVRLTGCPLRCQYCDTAYAFHGGKMMSVDAIVTQVKQYQTPYVTVTGGEPLAQEFCIPLLKQLCDQNYQVSLETSGALDISTVDIRVSRVLDIKTPGSGEETRNRFENIHHLTTHDQIKFVICNREDYEWAKQIIDQHHLMSYCQILFSPSYHQLSNRELADWILQDALGVRFQLQMHKYIWGDIPGH